MSSKVFMGVYKLGIGGKVIDDKILGLIRDVTYVDSVDNSADTLTININDPYFVFIDGDIFVEDTPVHFRGGWDDDVSLYFEGYISAIDIDFPEDGIPTLSITCMDNSRIMNKEKKRRTWHSKKVSEVVALIAQEHGFAVDIDDTGKVEDSISQGDVSDIEFIFTLAEEQDEDYVVKMSLNTLSFKKEKKLEEPQTILRYREFPFNVISFRPRVNKEDVSAKTTSSDIDNQGKVESGTADSSTQRDLQGKNSPKTNVEYVSNDGISWEKVGGNSGS